MNDDENQNERTIDGVQYVAIDPPDCESCETCAADGDTVLCVKLPPCERWFRTDKRDVVFVEAE